MGWSEKRFNQFAKGEKPTWLEKRILEHANPVNFIATVLAFAALIYGAWINDWTWIIVSVVIGFLGHLYCWYKE